MILVIDNYDSFTHNLARYFVELDQRVEVVRNDAITLAQIAALAPTHIVLSPGPCTPTEAGITLAVITRFAGHIPILGVCLGHQAIAQAYGAKIVRAPRAMHGKVSTLTHRQTGLFNALPLSFNVTRYHSLVIAPETLSPEFCVAATCEDGNVIMAIEAPALKLYGVQFHPESLLTEHGHALLANFLTQSRA